MNNLNRLTIKISGESGQGINSIGEVVAKALKRSGFYSFGYREYPSLIKGGHAFHQIDFSDHALNSPSRESDVLLAISRVSLHEYLPTLRENGQVLHLVDSPEFSEKEEEIIKAKKIKIEFLPAFKMASEAGGNAIMSNVVMVGALWKHLGLDLEVISELIKEEFADKPDMLDANVACLKKGFDFAFQKLKNLSVNFSKDIKRRDDALLTGNHLLALGAVAAGVRAYFAYPMTPSSSILSYMADISHETGVLVKQLDDEISVAQAAIGAMFAGTRALVATSGGGFDLMTESVSLAAMTETPFVSVLAQRPGPSTGMPTWTAAGDLNLALYSGHGEFARCVLSLGDSDSAYTVIQKAFNLAEKYQIPVIVMTEKQIAESLFQVDKLPNDIEIERSLVEGSDLKNLAPSDRFKITKSGISPRWLPGQADAMFVANSDEHLEDGTLTEEALASLEMANKRMEKLKTLEEEIPEPVLIGPEKASCTLVSWGSTRNTICDVMELWNEKHPKKAFNLLNFEYLFPLRTEKLYTLISKKQKMILVENNYFGQLGNLITQVTGYKFEKRFLKYDGRPFFVEDLLEFLQGKEKIYG